eukprot:350149-Chlamydomonas_euryale.AAC.24
MHIVTAHVESTCRHVCLHISQAAKHWPQATVPPTIRPSSTHAAFSRSQQRARASASGLERHPQARRALVSLLCRRLL